MTRLKMHTPDATNTNITRIAELFPHCVTEAKDEEGVVKRVIDFDQLRQELSDHVVDGPRERYHLDWPGKREAVLAANAPIAKTLRPCRDESVDFDTTKNLFVEGDNLDALKLLQETYLNKVKVIYIDPPYNTGKDFLYDDDFSEDANSYFIRSQQTTDSGERMLANPESNGRFHSDWLSMVYPRLKQARNLLRDDGLVFITIDDNEYANLQRACNEVFGEDNYLATMHVKVRYEGKTLVEDMDFQKLIEQVLIYRKSSAAKLKKQSQDYTLEKFCWRVVEKGIPKTVILGGKNVQVFPLGQYTIEACEPSNQGLKEIWATGKILDGNSSGRFFRDYLAGRTSEDGLGVLYKVPDIGDDGHGFRYFTGPKRDTATKGKYFQGVPADVLSGERNTKELPIATFFDFADSFGNCRHEGGVDFRDGKKPIKFLRSLLNIVELKDGDIVCDFFAGSCSTAHAVIENNVETQMAVQFVMVQVDQHTSVESDAYQSGFKTIADLGKERIRRAGKKLKDDNAITAPNLDVGFRVLKVDTSNMKEVYYLPDAITQATLAGLVDNVKDDRTDEDLLFQVLLDWGVDLTLAITPEKIGGKLVYFVDTNALAACFELGIDEAFIKEMAKHKPLRAVFRDTGYGSDATKINVEQIFKLLSPATEVKSI